MATQDKAIIRTVGVSVSFDGATALNSVDASVQTGRITVICGANGSGKSTLLRSMARLQTPTSGQVLFDGEDINRLKRIDLARKIAVLGQMPEVPAGLTVEELVENGRHPHRGLFSRLGEHDRQAIERAITQTGLHALRHRQVASLSGGERQRAWVALALAQEPSVLFLDEPTNFLDIRHQAELLTLLKQLNRDHGLTIVAVLHDLNQVLELADDVILMRKGHLMASGSPESVFTTERLREAFDFDIEVTVHPVLPIPFCMPRWVNDPTVQPSAEHARNAE
ncbi:iron ABC transporter ATP-binding protein [Ochrobactrum sp. P6BS-III]|uniref:ABC transporter ATP-binding protein n=1 Tax=unclassified Ochrobactrum TaxID=239106 RepID=UPI000991D66B|nr:iron complex transport system ATP-binding protein [Ochrobactrum sp. P6BSIII]OOL15474.1 iron ABC transporter ATP-binding protein [Ochrobactrum sp. P6BS-III]